MAAEPIELRRPADPGAPVIPEAIPATGSVHEDGTACTCGEENSKRIILDTRLIPHAIRHATIFGALDSIGLGGSIDLIASHNPLPLLAQLKQRNPDAFTISYLLEGPKDWALRLTRVAK
jgi:uncharacterized protein (DUF2249 family)